MKSDRNADIARKCMARAGKLGAVRMVALQNTPWAQAGDTIDPDLISHVSEGDLAEAIRMRQISVSSWDVAVIVAVAK